MWKKGYGRTTDHTIIVNHHPSSKSNPTSPRISKSSIKYKNGDIIRLRATISDRYIFKTADPTIGSDSSTTTPIVLSPVYPPDVDRIDYPTREEIVKSEKRSGLDKTASQQSNYSKLSRSTPTSPLGNHKINNRQTPTETPRTEYIQSLPAFIPHRIKLTERTTLNSDRSEVTSIVIPPTITNGSKTTSLAVRSELKLRRKNATPCLDTKVIRFSRIPTSNPTTEPNQSSPKLPNADEEKGFTNRSFDDELLLKAILDDDQATFEPNPECESIENTEHLQSLQIEIDKIVKLKTRHSEIITTTKDKEGLQRKKRKTHSKQYSDSTVVLQTRRYDLEETTQLSQSTTIPQ